MLSKIKYNSPVILTFTIISFFALILDFLTQSITTNLFFKVYRSSIIDPFFYIRLFGHIIGHVSWEHFLGNFLLIMIIGPMLEEKYGSKNLIIMIFITAFVTGLLNLIISDTALLGASGVVFMLILLSSFTNISKGTLPLTFLIVVILYLGKEVVDGLFARDSISQLAHIIGGLCGSVFGYTNFDKDILKSNKNILKNG